MRPEVTIEEAAALVAAHFGVQPVAGSVREMVSYEDRNFYLEADSDGCLRQLVLKVHNSEFTDMAGRLEAHNAAMHHLRATGIGSNVPLAAISGAEIAYMEQEHEAAGRLLVARHALRLLTFVPGRMYLDAPQLPALHRNFGAFLGRLSACLASLEAPALNIAHSWAMHVAPDTIRRLAPDVALFDLVQKARLLAIAEHCAAATAAAGGALRRQVCHCDANELNVVVGQREGTQIAGILDFGDMCVTWLVAEVAIALAYQMLLDVSNPFPAAAALLAAYLQQMPLAAEELAVVPALIKCRIALSLTMGAHSVSLMPGNEEYLLTTQKPGWALLGRLDGLSDEDMLAQMMVDTKCDN